LGFRLEAGAIGVASGPLVLPQCDSATALRADDMSRFRWSVSKQQRAYVRLVQLLAVLLLGVLSDR
jgi:hypothetical protein